MIARTLIAVMIIVRPFVMKRQQRCAHRNFTTHSGVTIHASLMFPADQVLPYMVRDTYRLPPTFFQTPPGTPSRIGPTHPTLVTSVPDPRISTPDTAPHISHDHCTLFIGMGLYAYL